MKIEFKCGTGILGLLGIAFIVLKLTGVIAWSWLWILAPFWVPFAIAAILLFIWMVIFIIVNHKS